MADRQRAAVGHGHRPSRRRGAVLGRQTQDRVLISGYYGAGNLGDEAVLAGLLAEFRARRPDLAVTVLSANPPGTAALHRVDAWPRAPLAVWRALAHARGLISGGGSLVQDVTSARSALYYLGVIAAASVRGVPVAIIGQGVGPIRRPWMRRLARWTFNRAAVISVRDGDSARLLASIGVERTPHRGADLAALMPPAPPERINTLLADTGLDGARERVGVAVRAWPGLLEAAVIGAQIRRFAASSRAAVVVLPFDIIRDRAVSEAVASSAGGMVVEPASPQEMLALVGAMDLIVGVRLHALVFAVLQGVPAVGVAYDPKVSAFAEEHGLPSLPAALEAPAFEQALAETWERRRQLRDRLVESREGLRRRASDAVGAAVELFARSAPHNGRSSPRLDGIGPETGIS